MAFRIRLQELANSVGRIARRALQKEVRRVDFHHGGCGCMVVDKSGRGVGNQTIVLGGQTEHGDVHIGEGSADVALQNRAQSFPDGCRGKASKRLLV